MTTSSSSPKSSVILLATQPFITSQFTFLRSTFRSYSFGNLRVLRSLASLLQSHKYYLFDIFRMYGTIGREAHSVQCIGASCRRLL